MLSFCPIASRNDPENQYRNVRRKAAPRCKMIALWQMMPIDEYFLAPYACPQTVCTALAMPSCCLLSDNLS
uniref:Uncharacterized protein n=1 Tax=Salix viminalis TaxID=40686 RepID=A0A6N2MRL3_SALVM